MVNTRKNRNPLSQIVSPGRRKLSGADKRIISHAEEIRRAQSRETGITRQIEALDSYYFESKHTPKQKITNLRALLKESPPEAVRRKIEALIVKLGENTTIKKKATKK